MPTKKINRIKSIQLKALKAKRRFKAHKIIQNRYFRRRPAKRIRSRSEKANVYSGNSNITRKVIKIPEIFSITEEINIVLKFIYENKKLVEYKKISQFVFDFTDVIKIDDGAATILLSFCHDMSYKQIRVGINNLPQDENSKLFIQQSGFLKYFSGPLAGSKEDNLNTTLKKGKSTILQKDSAALIHKSMKTVWNEEKRNQRLQGMLIELMTNSVNHAYLNNDRQKSWYISTKHHIEQNKVEFCFVDNGDGIINTINIKLKDKFLTSNEDLLIRAFNGEFRSRTKLANRGRGLIVVKSNQENMTIKGLKVITNNVFLNFESKTAQRLRTSFSGTFYSWVIDKSCK